MDTEQSKRKQRSIETAARRSERLDRRAKDRNADNTAEDANIQRMIERNIKDHGA